MSNARALLLVVLVSVCLLVIFVNPHAMAEGQLSEELEPCIPNDEQNCDEQPSSQSSTTAKEKPGSDPSRPSESIKAEEPDTVIIEGL